MTAELADATTRDDWGPQRSRTVTWHEPDRALPRA